MENMLKTLIIITLIYYLVKGLLYLAMWQMTYKVQERQLEEKEKKKAKRMEKIANRKIYKNHKEQ